VGFYRECKSKKCGEYNGFFFIYLCHGCLEKARANFPQGWLTRPGDTCYVHARYQCSECSTEQRQKKTVDEGDSGDVVEKVRALCEQRVSLWRIRVMLDISPKDLFKIVRENHIVIPDNPIRRRERKSSN
jgi:hypothetical protein